MKQQGAVTGRELTVGHVEAMRTERGVHNPGGIEGDIPKETDAKCARQGWTH